MTASSRRPLRLALLLSTAGVALWLAGCASGPTPGPGKAPRPGTSDRDGAPMSPPSDLVKVPDAEPRVEPIRQGGPNKPYVVLGQGYEPLSGDVAFKERGTASWYGTKFHGRRTASGEVYSMYGMTAAHRTLPIPSYARVRDVRTGKEVIVRINDRGPFHSSRVIDLSYTAATKLDMLGRGSTEVEIERLTFDQIRTGQWRSGLAVAKVDPTPPPLGPMPIPAAQTVQNAAPVLTVSTPAPALEPVPPGEDDPILALASQLDGAAPTPAVNRASGDESPPPAGNSPVSQARAFTPASKGFWVQLAAFSQRTGVDAFQKRVADEMLNLSPLLGVFQEGKVYRVQAGPYATRADAQAVAGRVRDALRLAPMVVERR
ncbi:MAG TPA: septal ring lytic transglycosylase RlpA family protein [Candidatus Aquabacterium excrementipullorum]|nr:septal ring lytic transglycosylase RlpA family protein [Candidatus Aquabacterium excrementipullorum]